MHGEPTAAAPRARRYYIDYVGNMGNCMLQLLFALRLQEHIGPGDIVTCDARVADRLSCWDGAIKLISEAPLNALHIRHFKGINNTLKLYRRAAAHDVRISTCNFPAALYPDLALAKQFFLPKEAVNAPVYGSDYLVINIRGAEILRGVHPDYALAPVSFYKALVEETGLKPVFVGQLGNNPYIAAIKQEFPDAIYQPSVSAIFDFQTVRNATHIVPCVSSFSALAAWLSDAKTIFFPVLGAFNPFQRPDCSNLPADDPRYRLFLFPLFFMGSITHVLQSLETHLGKWKEMTYSQLNELMKSPPRNPATLEDMLAHFDASYYVAQHPDVANALSNGEFADAREHYVSVGHRLGRAPFHLDPVWYSREYPDAALSIVERETAGFLEHFCVIGHRKGYQKAAPG